jgi:phosphoribosyl-dephospho-CoA transferase
MTHPQPHDLLWITNASALLAPDALPGWVHEAMQQAPAVVVRRALPSNGNIPIGIRGPSRSQRFAAMISIETVQKRITPEDLVHQQAWQNNARPDFAPICRALHSIALQWNSLNLAWGPAGSAGFELATGVPCTTAESDLDLIVRAPRPISKIDANSLLQSVTGLEIPADIRIETPFGSIALKEYASPSSPRLLMKTNRGPQLVADPWNPEEKESK